MNPQPQTGPPAPNSARMAVARSNSNVVPMPLNAATASAIERQLRSGSVLEQIYRPMLPVYSTRGAEALAYYFYADAEVMRMHDAVRLPLSYVMGPLYHAQWVVEASSRAVAIFTAKMLQWFWQNALHAVAKEGYTYGWCGTEFDYCEKDGLLIFDEARTYSPRDTYPLLHPKTRKPVGFRVRGTMGEIKNVWAWRDDVPNKGFWYTHQPRYGLLLGESQIRAAWRPWRRLAGTDGLEEIEDLATYKHGVGVQIMRHPNEVQRAEESANPQYAVNGYVHTQDVARAMVQNSRYGSAMALPSETWGMAGGGLKWDYDVRAFQTNISQLGEHDDRLSRRCSRAIGVPPELFEAAQTGSGYSGREIPLEGFLQGQQDNLNHLTRSFVKYAIVPLARWNYGGRAWATAMPKSLLDTARGGSKNAPPAEEQQRPAQSQGVDLPSNPSGADQPTMMSRIPDPATLSLGEMVDVVRSLESKL